MEYVQENYIEDVYVYRIIENILIKNLNAIDYVTKSMTVFILGKNIYKKKLKLKDENWYLIFYDFISIADTLDFASYYNYIVTFDKIKNRLHGIYADIDRFLENTNMKLFNSRKMKLENMDDLILFSGLIHNKVISFRNLNLNIWSDINRIIAKYENDINTNSLLILTSIMITYLETNPDISSINRVENGLIALNRHLDLTYSNYELLSSNEQNNLIEFSDTILYYYSLLYPVLVNHPFYVFNQAFTNNLIKNYKAKLEKNAFGFFQEVRILVLIGKELKYKDMEFWDVAARCVSEWLEVKFMKMLGEITSKRIANSAIKEEDVLLLDLSYFFFGVIIDTFACVEYKDFEFWKQLAVKMEEFTNFTTKDQMTILKFISNNARRLLNDDYSEIWEMYTQKFENNFKSILRNKELLEYLLKINFINNEINIDEFNKHISEVFLDTKNTIPMFIALMKLIDTIIFSPLNEKCLKVMANILVDLNSIEKNSTSSNIIQKAYFDKLHDIYKSKIKKFIISRILSIELTADKIKHIIVNMKISNILDNLDIAELKYKLKNNELINKL
jgi:hypothetical protein